jgi:hypothetical protein
MDFVKVSRVPTLKQGPSHCTRRTVCCDASKTNPDEKIMWSTSISISRVERVPGVKIVLNHECKGYV